MRTMKHWALAAMAAAAIALAGCGGGGSAPPQATGPDPALVAARTAAMTAVDAAKEAADDAAAEAAAVEANRSADPASYALAREAARRAMAAYGAAKAASAAAAATTDTAVAQGHQATAEEEQAKAEAELTNAMTYAQMVADAHAEMVAEAERERQAAEAARMAQHTEVSDAIDAANTAVAALSNMSTDAEVDAAQALIDAAKADLADADLLSANQVSALTSRLSTIESTLASTESDIADHRHMVAVEQQRTAVSGVIDMAMAAVGALSGTSSDDDVTAAKAAIQDAKDALNDAALLSANQVLLLENRLSAIEGDLATAEADIADHRQMVADMATQRMAANTAIDAANTAVARLSETSTDAEVEAAKDAIQAAKDAVTAATALSMADRDGLNDRISNIETMLASTESDIGDHRQMVAEEAERMRLATAASDAVDAANTAVAGLTNASTDEEVQAAKDAIQAAHDAIDAANAGSALTATDATAHSRRISMIESSLAMTETAITAYRVMVAEDAETQRVADVADARSRAMQSYVDADGDATKAEAAANEAEATSPGSQGAMDARTAATAARNAANAAKAAHDAIMDDMTKEAADAQATEAATQAGNANEEYASAKRENDAIQTAAATSGEQLRERDVAAATIAAEKAATAARTAATNARTHATNARTAANAAKASYERAKSARTDSEEANTQYMAADAAATEAENAATAAEMAADDAEAAHAGIDSEGSAADAEAAQMTAETEQGEAETSMGTAYAQMGTANTARDDAMTAADTHVVGLLRMANAYHITGPDGDPANTEAEEAELIAKNKRDHIGMVNTAVKTAADDTAAPSHGGGTVTATWPHSATVANADANEDTERTGKPVISVTPEGGDAVALQHAGPGATDATTDDLLNNFVQGPGLGDFVHEKYISGLNATTTDDLNDFNNQRVILFTDLEQASEPKDARTDTVDNEAVSTASQVGITGDIVEATATVPRNFPGSYDHDGDPKTPAFTGTFTCADPLTCRVSRTGTTDTGGHVAGETEVTSIANYRFTGTRTIAEMNPVEDTTWLAFGVWLTETVVDEGVNTYAFGAFADGGDATESTEGQVVTGSATYQGKAAGVHSRTSGVNFFHGDATLTADFGTRATNGMITGRIHNIESGGNPVADSIYLYLSDQDADAATPSNITDAGGFSGRTRMGTGTLGDDGEYDYPMNGTWVGSFYNPVADDTTTTTVMEDETAPGSVAGTFSVSRGNDDDTTMVDETESYVGAFGAHCSGSNCNPH